MSAVALLLLLQAQALDAEELLALSDPAREVRERAIASLAAGDAPIARFVPHLEGQDTRVARAVIEVCRRRLDPGALAALARCADHVDASRAEQAARAATAIVFAHGLDLEALHFMGMRALPQRLQRAVELEVGRLLPRLPRPGHSDRAQDYRPLMGGGVYAARALERVARRTDEPDAVRDHALRALALLSGGLSEPVLRELADDASPRVRVVCSSLLYQFGGAKAREFLAKRLDSRRMHREQEMQWVVLGVERTGLLTETGTRKLVRLVLDGTTNRALGAAAALRKTRPRRFEAALGARLDRKLRSDKKHPGSSSEVALFEFRVGPLPEETRERMRASTDPLLLATALADRAKALRVIEPMIAPGRSLGSREPLRVRVVYHLLDRLDAPHEARVRFARSALDSQVVSSRRYALGALRDVPAPLWKELRQRVETLLEDEYESVRLAAARLLAPADRAVEVAVMALFDGGPGAAHTVQRILQKARPTWPAVQPGAAVVDRRRLARRLMALFRSVRRDKE